jgi:transposase
MMFLSMSYRVSLWTHTKTPPRIQILSISDTGRRRRWADGGQVRIFEQSHRDGVTLAEVARRHEISRSMLYDWRSRHKLGLFGC